MFYHNINPVILDVGPLSIRYYGLFYLIGMVITFFLLGFLIKENGLKLKDDDIVDFILYMAFGMFIGARIIYFVFYQTGTLFSAPWEIFFIWQGGMSFHGGIIGTAVGGYIFSKKKKISFYRLADMVVMPVALALALGRIGNFINGELYGRLWENPILNGALCIDYSRNEFLARVPEGCRYPSQLIESGKNIVIFFILWSIRNKEELFSRKVPDGFLFWSFILLYGLFRFFIEFIRQFDPQVGLFFGFMSMGQILCLVMIAVGGFMSFKLWKE